MTAQFKSRQNLLQKTSISVACVLVLILPCLASCMWCAAVSMQPTQLYQKIRQNIVQLTIFLSTGHLKHHCKIYGVDFPNIY